MEPKKRRSELEDCICRINVVNTHATGTGATVWRSGEFSESREITPAFISKSLSADRGAPQVSGRRTYSGSRQEKGSRHRRSLGCHSSHTRRGERPYSEVSGSRLLFMREKDIASGPHSDITHEIPPPGDQEGGDARPNMSQFYGRKFPGCRDRLRTLPDESSAAKGSIWTPSR